MNHTHLPNDSARAKSLDALDWKLRSLPETDAPPLLISRVLGELQAEQALVRRLSDEANRWEQMAAPASLVPRVVLAIQERARPFWQRAWTTWPRPLQAASAVSFLLCVWFVAGALLQYWPAETVGTTFEQGQLWLERLAASAQVRLAPLGQAAQLFAGVPLYLFAAAVCLYLLLFVACVGLGTACLHLAVPGFIPRRVALLPGSSEPPVIYRR